MTDGWGGERQVGKTIDEIEPKHVERYERALKYCNGVNVLDAACGCGYGSNILAHNAKSVLGIDKSSDAIKYANDHWKASNIAFLQYNLKDGCSKLGEFDTIVSFETIEHLAAPLLVTLSNFYDILNKGGILIISHPENETPKMPGAYLLKLTFHQHFAIDGKAVRNILEAGLKMEILDDRYQEGRWKFPYHILVAKK